MIECEPLMKCFDKLPYKLTIPIKSELLYMTHLDLFSDSINNYGAVENPDMITI